MGYLRKPAGRLRLRYPCAVLLDACAVMLSLHVALRLRLQGPISDSTASGAALGAISSAIISIAVFHIVGIYRQSWRHVSIKELLFLGQASILSVALSSIVILLLFSTPPWLPRSVPIIQWFVLVVMLGSLRAGPRILRELLRPAPPLPVNAPPGSRERGPARQNVLLVGEPDWAETVLRVLKDGRNPAVTAVGILAHDDRDRNLNIRGVPIFGTIDELEAVVGQLTRAKRRPSYLIVSQGDPALTGPRIAKLATRAAQLGLELARAQEPGQLQHSRDGNLDLEFLNLTDLLGRAEMRLDGALVREAIKGRRILVTGAGGTIGGELVRQIAAFEASEILLLDHGEYNLYAIDLELRESFPAVRSTPLLCSIRQRDTLIKLFCQHRPDLVFHAAALKHVPLVEANPCAGVLTNVIGTRNVADAVLACGARAMIQVSTDKAVNPIGMMGATKRLGELYCQALDLASPREAGACRFITVRFGNVLGSSGSLIPLFMRQLSRRGPLTVTHPDIERYFMTVHEAVRLILHSSAGSLQGGMDRGRIFVLDMGAPIKIVDIARRIIRAAGLEPDIDVKIEFVGLRPGEKLFEELFDSSEERLPSSLPGIFEAAPHPVALTVLKGVFERLEDLARYGDAEAMCTIVRSIVDFHEEKPAAPPRPADSPATPHMAPARLQQAR
ncbi:MULTISPECIES: nucleoside-diphosphate sugar epimerase/dehydratase [unclassified Sphingomonas]|uniref:nucleoside-diphosphate sugar epimerase/dehydratase n=1 Tax=unclassified Sphingomonas TaxID=196159 RepID=UPI0006F1E300|nr:MULTISPECIES: nucleoside-diphosphate sugar epimerase/dehydratase [unclassified Sphingomonas]KQX19492.1 hypothetical protein ASD17_13290 [Sphingomonas sp. Root1294]KQY65693.1 hypothetical protein ASD39_16490 [Sphingomonas sp. Root50]KRB95003.1 hypothetical protein ASE22_03565 [Sphingomonas sp. Root720]